MNASRAKLFAVEASARYEPSRNGGCDRTNLLFFFATLYGVSTALGPDAILMKCQVASLPSSSSEASASITPAGRKYAQVNSSSRVHRSITGLPAPLASRAASTATSPVCLPP